MMKPLNEEARKLSRALTQPVGEGVPAILDVCRAAIREARDEGALDMADMLRGLPCDQGQRIGVMLAAQAIEDYVALRRERAKATPMTDLDYSTLDPGIRRTVRT